MAESSTDVVRFVVDESELVCGLVPVNNSDIVQRLGGRVCVSLIKRRQHHWSTLYFKTLLFMTQGPSFVLFPSLLDREEMSAVASKWRKSLEKGSGPDERWEEKFTIGFGESGAAQTQIVFVALPCEAGGLQEPFASLILGFEIPYGSLDFVVDRIGHIRIPLILDLDDTLLLAYSLSDLKQRIALAKNKRVNGEHVDREINSLQQDLIWLTQYSKSDTVEIGNLTLTASPEPIEKGMTRPVIRMESQSVILTRINPKDPKTSMLIRLRPGWIELKEELMKRPACRQQGKFDVYISTTADRDYALEAWRLLDPDEELIAKADLRHRLCCVKKNGKKSMKGVLKGSIMKFDIGEVPGAWEMPFAIIADDRKDVWEQSAQGQVIMVEPFAPHSRIVEIQSEYKKGGTALNIPWLSLKFLTDEISNLSTRFWYYFDNGVIFGHGDLSDPAARVLSLPLMRSLSSLLLDEDEIWTLERPTEDKLPVFTGKSNCEIKIPHPVSVSARWFASNPAGGVQSSDGKDKMLKRKRSMSKASRGKSKMEGRLHSKVGGHSKDRSTDKASQAEPERTGERSKSKMSQTGDKIGQSLSSAMARATVLGTAAESESRDNSTHKESSSSGPAKHLEKRPRVRTCLWKNMTAHRKGLTTGLAIFPPMSRSASLQEW